MRSQQTLAVPAAPRITLASVLSDTLGITKRNLKRTLRTPQLLAFSAIQPVMAGAAGIAINRYRKA